MRPRPLTYLLLPQLIFVSVFVSVFFLPLYVCIDLCLTVADCRCSAATTCVCSCVCICMCICVCICVSIHLQVLMPRPLSDVPTAQLPPQPVPAKNTLCLLPEPIPSSLPSSWRTVHDFLLLQDLDLWGASPSLTTLACRFGLSSNLTGTGCPPDSKAHSCQAVKLSENHANSKSEQFSA